MYQFECLATSDRLLYNYLATGNMAGALDTRFSHLTPFQARRTLHRSLDGFKQSPTTVVASYDGT